MADDNKPLKYARYAIGEIVLVVVGILIALQINNWNEKNINDKIVQEYLLKISSNVDSDIKKLQFLINDRSEGLMLCDSIVEYYEEKIISNPKLFEKGFFNIFIEKRFNANTTAYESLKSSGLINNLRHSEIEEKLSSYYYLMEKVVFVENKFNNSTSNSEDGLTQKGFFIEYKKAFTWSNKDTINFNYQSLIKYPELESEFIKGRLFLEELITDYSSLLDRGKEVSELINKEFLPLN